MQVPNVGDASAIELVSWYVRADEEVSKGQELCELVTDKAAFPLEAPSNGRVLRILKPTGSQVEVGDALLEFAPQQGLL